MICQMWLAFTASNRLRKLVLYPTELRGHVGSVVFQLSQNYSNILLKIPAKSRNFLRFPAITWGKGGDL